MIGKAVAQPTSVMNSRHLMSAPGLTTGILPIKPSTLEGLGASSDTDGRPMSVQGHEPPPRPVAGAAAPPLIADNRSVAISHAMDQ